MKIKANFDKNLFINKAIDISFKGIFTILLFIFLLTPNANAKLNGFYVGILGGSQSASGRFDEYTAAKKAPSYDNYIGMKKSNSSFFGGKIGYMHQFPSKSNISFLMGIEGDFYFKNKHEFSTEGVSVANLCASGVFDCTGILPSSATESRIKVGFKNNGDILFKTGIGIADKGMVYGVIGASFGSFNFATELQSGSGLQNYELNKKKVMGLYLGAGVAGNVDDNVQLGVEYFYTRHVYKFHTDQASLISGVSSKDSDMVMNIKNSGVKMYVNFLF